MQDLQDLVQDLASLARKILATFGYFLQHGGCVLYLAIVNKFLALADIKAFIRMYM